MDLNVNDSSSTLFTVKLGAVRRESKKKNRALQPNNS